MNVDSMVVETVAVMGRIVPRDEAEKGLEPEKKKRKVSPNVGLGLKKHVDKMRNNPEYRQMMVEKYKKNRPNAIAVDMIDKETLEVVKTFSKIMDGANWIRENTAYKKADYATINKICKKQGKTAYGYKWRYVKDR